MNIKESLKKEIFNKDIKDLNINNILKIYLKEDLIYKNKNLLIKDFFYESEFVKYISQNNKANITEETEADENELYFKEFNFHLLENTHEIYFYHISTDMHEVSQIEIKKLNYINDLAIEKQITIEKDKDDKITYIKINMSFNNYIEKIINSEEVDNIKQYMSFGYRYNFKNKKIELEKNFNEEVYNYLLSNILENGGLKEKDFEFCELRYDFYADKLKSNLIEYFDENNNFLDVLKEDYELINWIVLNF